MTVTNPYQEQHRRDAETVQALLEMRAMAASQDYDAKALVRRIDRLIEQMGFTRIPNNQDQQP